VFNSPASILVNQAQVIIGFSQPGLYTTFSDQGNINCAGSPLPSTVSLTNLFAAHTVFASTRVTEGFASSFQKRGTGDDTGTRFLVKYSGFPSNARVFLPDFVSGTGSAAATSGGDLGLPQQVGQYTPGSGTLLLARVMFADSTGVGGFIPALPVGPLEGVSEV